ncbi:MAG: cysteine synthase family protein [Gammaproteobacteria bacterium]|nr:cysteine synthase family protein [Gammaproteobacteria bacterium]
MKIVTNLADLIGNTPLLKLKVANQNWNVYLKLENFNPSGSFKDRTAWGLILAAEKKGDLKPGMTLIESSSGNTAKALAMLAASRGYKFIAVVDKHAPSDKLNSIRTYGGQLHFCTDEEDKEGGHLVDIRREVAKRLAKELPNAINLDQYDNANNPLAYYHTLGPELCEQLDQIDYLVGTIGTGSSLSGTARYLKEKRPETTVIALEPTGSAHFSPRGHGYHISGPGYPPGAKLPKNIDHSVFDQHDTVSDAEAFNTMRFFAKNKGLLFGDSGGMLLYYAMKYIKNFEGPAQNKNMVLIIGDGGESYLSHAYNDTWMIENELLDLKYEPDLKDFYR